VVSGLRSSPKMQHQTAPPYKEGSAQGPLIQVTLFGTNGQPLRDFLLKETCVQVSNGC
jgi:hypothetical protein